MVLKKEAAKTQNRELERGGEYRQLLVSAMHTCAARFPDVAGSVLHLLMDFLTDANAAPALDVIFFVREIIEVRPHSSWAAGAGLRRAVMRGCSSGVVARGLGCSASGTAERQPRWPAARRPTRSCTTPSWSA